LVHEREAFNSKRAITSFLGFATSQLNESSKPHSTGKMGASRKELVERYGFDVKFCYHAIRSARTILEFVENGGRKLNVERADAADLLKIRNGERNLKSCKEEYDDTKSRIAMLEPSCGLPDRPDEERINQLLVASMKLHLLQ
jgi:hypothetical protein